MYLGSTAAWDSRNPRRLSRFVNYCYYAAYLFLVISSLSWYVWIFSRSLSAGTLHDGFFLCIVVVLLGLFICLVCFLSQLKDCVICPWSFRMVGI